jgi:adenosylhomocysteine nucleosidase
MSLSTLAFKNDLLVFALETEARGLFDSFHTLFCGVGKVNATYGLTSKLAEWQKAKGQSPALVLNVGSAGSRSFSRGDVVNCTRFIQRDFDATALGVAPYETPFEESPSASIKGVRHEAFPEGICGTGDSFVINKEKGSWTVVDMEAFALAKVCHREKIHFGCLKYITDGANDHSATDWIASLDDTARTLRGAVDVFLGVPD